MVALTGLGRGNSAGAPFLKVGPTAGRRRRRRSILALSVSVLLLSGCAEDEPVVAGQAPAVTPTPDGQSLQPPGPARTAAGSQAPAARDGSAPPAPEDSRGAEPVAAFRTAEMRDPLVNDEVALTYLLPEGWDVRGGIEWRVNELPLAAGTAEFVAPDGRTVLQGFWPTRFSWVDNPLYQHPGSNWNGAIMAPPPADAVDAVTRYLLPQIRPGATVVDATGVDLTGSLGADWQGARVRLAYDDGSGPVEEIVVATVFSISAATGTGTLTQWGFGIAYGQRAPQGQLETALPLMEAIVSSIDVDQRWQAGYEYVLQLFVQRQLDAIRQAGELSRYLSQVGDEISQIQREAWENQQRTNDAVFRDFSEYIRDTQRVRTQQGGVVSTPEGTACQSGSTIVVYRNDPACPAGTTQLFTP